MHHMTFDLSIFSLHYSVKLHLMLKIHTFNIYITFMVAKS